MDFGRDSPDQTDLLDIAPSGIPPTIISHSKGVNGCVRYKVESTNKDGMARYAALYDIDSPEVPTSAGWLKESEKGDWPTQIRPHATNRSHTIYKKIE